MAFWLHAKGFRLTLWACPFNRDEALHKLDEGGKDMETLASEGSFYQNLQNLDILCQGHYDEMSTNGNTFNWDLVPSEGVVGCVSCQIFGRPPHK